MNTSSYQLDLPPLWRRPLTGIMAVLLIISTGLNVLASVIPASTLPGWVGVVDVALAVVLIILGLVITAVAGGNIHSLEVHTSYKVYRALATVLLVLLGIFFYSSFRLHWDVLLPGLAWRAWLFVYVLPAALTLWRSKLYAKNERLLHLNRSR